ncbi:MAG TPA: hypothetical protein VLY45_00230 [Nitrospiria bacterium]|nr:hypothetical protein [Nitrospiria bacterium]
MKTAALKDRFGRFASDMRRGRHVDNDFAVEPIVEPQLPLRLRRRRRGGPHPERATVPSASYE